MTETYKSVQVNVKPQARSVSIVQPPTVIGANVALTGQSRGLTVNIEVLPVRVIGTVDWYDGDYEVNPKFVEQQLETQNKGMREDVQVHAIRVAVTTNPQGGNTVWIGEE